LVRGIIIGGIRNRDTRAERITAKFYESFRPIFLGRGAVSAKGVGVPKTGEAPKSKNSPEGAMGLCRERIDRNFWKVFRTRCEICTSLTREGIRLFPDT